jgi:FtsZ-interacting cell division protein YlmF
MQKKVDELNNMSIKDFVKLFANIFKEEDARLQKEEEEEERIRQEEERIRQEEEQLRQAKKTSQQKPDQLDENDCKPNKTYNSYTKTCSATHDGGSKKKSNKRIKRKRRNKTRKYKKRN